MADLYSDLLRLILQTDGENPNTWGAKTNTNVTLIERAISKRQDVVLASSDYTLTTANGAEDEARSLALHLTGTISANVNVIIPNKSKFYVARNATVGAFTVTVKTSGGTGVAIPQGQTLMVWCDGIGSGTVYSTIDTSAARASSRNIWTEGNSDAWETVTDAGTSIIDCAEGNVFRWTIAGNRTVQIDNPADGSWIELYVKQDATGGRAATWPANVVWVGGATPTLSPTANVVDKVLMRYDPSVAIWYADIRKNISAGASTTITEITIVDGAFDADIFARAGSPAGAVTVNVVIETGAVVGASSPASPAMNFDGFATGSTIAIVNRGYVLGRGGRGGRGAFAGDVDGANLFGDGTAGTDGGDAIKLPSNACTITIDNTSGFIWGGGGGGGGGGVTHNGDGTNVGVGGGGGGGGNGGGIPGDGGSIVSANGAPGTAGGIGRQGAAGTGGAGADTGGTGTAGNGGAGGDYGANGTAGDTQTANTFDGAPGTGGLAGKAINVNGGTAPVFTGGSGSPNVKGAVS